MSPPLSPPLRARLRDQGWPTGWRAPVAIAPLAAALILGLPTIARAHGAKLDHQTVQAIEAIARYDSGEPMAGASVTVYGPEDPQNPWSTGTTDGEGRFWFRPDRPGTWELKVRQAGHGALVAIAVEESALTPTGSVSPGVTPAAAPAAPLGATLSPPSGAPSPLSRWITIAAVTWGCIGTALFFSRRSPTP